MRIAEPARKHGIADEDIRHAVRNAIAQWQLDDDLTMRVGPARDGDLALTLGAGNVSQAGDKILEALRGRK